jgi:hypothetical protein
VSSDFDENGGDNLPDFIRGWLSLN